MDEQNLNELFKGGIGATLGCCILTLYYWMNPSAFPGFLGGEDYYPISIIGAAFGGCVTKIVSLVAK